MRRCFSMSVYQQYYNDLSSDESDADSSVTCSSDDDDGNESDALRRHINNNSRNGSNNNNNDNSLWSKSIVHIDVDCFYVQCEEIDRGLRQQNNNSNSNYNSNYNIQQQQQQQERPLAIGQKHIVVTCNYVARSRGVTKLMSKTDAMIKCPDLWIVDGSDLRDYRNHSRTIYKAFREAVQNEIASLVSWNDHDINVSIEEILPCKRNAMDEMMTDLSYVVDKLVQLDNSHTTTTTTTRTKTLISRLKQSKEFPSPQHQTSKVFVFGEDASSSKAHIVEDQTGASSSIVFQGKNNRNRSLAPTRRNVHEDTAYSNAMAKTKCRKRLQITTLLAQWICESIENQTKFHVSAGVSISPLLAKLSMLEKPKTVNLLLPWRSSTLLYPMPLRKMNDIGSRTHKALVKAINNNNNNNNLKVQDLLKVPRDTIVEALRTMGQHPGNKDACEQTCDTILDRCRGFDSTLIIDDGGGLPKTVSVENSFRRGTLTNFNAKEALMELCSRLPLLVKDRLVWSKHPSLAYPTTIRLTVRTICETTTKKQTRSKQAGMPSARGKLLLASPQENVVQMLLDCTSSLLQHLVVDTNKHKTIHITRMNLAVANFQDVSKQSVSANPIINAGHNDSMIHNTESVPRVARNNGHSEHPYRKAIHGNETKTKPKTKPTILNSLSASSTTTKPAILKSLSTTKRKTSIQKQPSSAQKFSRTRIDQFFAKKAR